MKEKDFYLVLQLYDYVDPNYENQTISKSDWQERIKKRSSKIILFNIQLLFASFYLNGVIMSEKL